MFSLALMENFYRSNVSLSSYHIDDTYNHYDSLLLTWTLIIWIRQCWAGFYAVKLPFCPHPLPHCNLWKKVSEQLHLRSVYLFSLSFTAEEMNYFKISCMSYLSWLRHLFNNLLIAVWIHEYLFNPGYDPIFFFQMIPSLAVGSFCINS